MRNIPGRQFFSGVQVITEEEDQGVSGGNPYKEPEELKTGSRLTNASFVTCLLYHAFCGQ